LAVVETGKKGRYVELFLGVKRKKEKQYE